MAYTKRTRVQAVLRGDKPDYPPFSCWYHFTPDQVRGQVAADAHFAHIDQLDLDFVKVMNDNEYPRESPNAVIESVADLKALRVHGPEAKEFSDQLDVLRRMAERLGGELLMTTTVFNPWATLRKLCGPFSDKHGPPKLGKATDDRDARITVLLREDRAAVAAAVATIGETLAGFARACIAAGADGVFLSVRDEWVDTEANGFETYDEILREPDLAILEAASAGTFNMLHVCGNPRDFDRFAQYPAHAINWADRCTPPSIADVRDTAKPALSGGLNNLGTLVEGTPERCAAEARDAVAQAGDRPILITPGCTYDPDAVPLENLIAARDAVRNG